MSAIIFWIRVMSHAGTGSTWHGLVAAGHERLLEPTGLNRNSSLAVCRPLFLNRWRMPGGTKTKSPECAV